MDTTAFFLFFDLVLVIVDDADDRRLWFACLLVGWFHCSAVAMACLRFFSIDLARQGLRFF